MPKQRKYPGRADWRTLPRSEGGGRPHKWGEWGKLVRMNTNWPEKIRALLIERYGSEQAAINELIIRPVAEEDQLG